jgi:hypothetical protein
MRYVRSLAAVVSVLAVAIPAAPASAAPDSIDLIAPRGNAAYDAGTHNIAVTYVIVASPTIPASAVHGVQAAIDHWNWCFAGNDSFTETFAPDTFTVTDSGCSGLLFKNHWEFVPPDAGTRALVSIRIKKGGGVVLGQTNLSFDSSGFLDAARMQISGSTFGLANGAQVVWNIAAHELGHVVGLGHSDVETDLMFPSINGTVSFGSCEIDGAEELYGSWLPGSDPALPSVDPVPCT